MPHHPPHPHPHLFVLKSQHSRFDHLASSALCTSIALFLSGRRHCLKYTKGESRGFFSFFCKASLGAEKEHQERENGLFLSLSYYLYSILIKGFLFFFLLVVSFPFFCYVCCSDALYWLQECSSALFFCISVCFAKNGGWFSVLFSCTTCFIFSFIAYMSVVVVVVLRNRPVALTLCIQTRDQQFLLCVSFFFSFYPWVRSSALSG